MPRNGSSVYSKASGTTAEPNTTITSSQFNSTIDDIVTDLNLDRPIAAGGTGASTAAAARTNLGLGSSESPTFAGLVVSTAAALRRDVNNSFLRISGGNANNVGANIELYGGTDASFADRAYYDADRHTFRLQAGASDLLRVEGQGLAMIVDGDAANPAIYWGGNDGIYHLTGSLRFAAAGVEQMRITGQGLTMITDGTAANPSLYWDGDDGIFHQSNSIAIVTQGTRRAFVRSTDGFWCVGKAADGGIEDPGCVLGTDGNVVFTRSAEAPLSINRLADDGGLILLYQAGTLEGSISVSGTTVSLNGAHLSRWSQWRSDPGEVLRGTVLASVDEMCAWPGEENENLPRAKVSDVPSDRGVTGVYEGPDASDGLGDFFIAESGDFPVRIGPRTNVRNGDLLESAGDGTARPQADDLVRSSTFAKVIAAVPITTYPDGSYLVPCMLKV